MPAKGTINDANFDEAELVVTALVLLLKLGLGILLLVAGFAKLRDPSGFAEEIANYQLWPSSAPYLAATLPSVEIVVGVVLVIVPGRSIWLQAGALCTALLMVAFTIGTSHVVARGIDIDCGCFGGDSGPVTGTTIARDVVLIVAAVALFVVARLRAAQFANEKR